MLLLLLLSFDSQTLAAIILSSQVFTDSDDFDINEDVLQDNPIELVFTINVSCVILQLHAIINPACVCVQSNTSN